MSESIEIHQETPKVEKEALWVTATNGDDFRCLHLDDAKIMETLLRKTVTLLQGYGDHGLEFEACARELKEEILVYLES